MQDLEILSSLHLISEAGLMLLVWKELTQFSSDLSGAPCFFKHVFYINLCRPLQLSKVNSRTTLSRISQFCFKSSCSLNT